LSAATGYPEAVMNGTVSFVPSTQGGIEFVVPFTGSNLFLPCGNNSPYDASGDTNIDNYALRNYFIDASVQAITAQNVRVTEETAIDEDFMMQYFYAVSPFSYPT
jgi:hypothetical protein